MYSLISALKKEETTRKKRWTDGWKDERIELKYENISRH